MLRDWFAIRRCKKKKKTTFPLWERESWTKKNNFPAQYVLSVLNTTHMFLTKSQWWFFFLFEILFIYFFIVSCSSAVWRGNKIILFFLKSGSPTYTHTHPMHTQHTIKTLKGLMTTNAENLSSYQHLRQAENPYVVKQNVEKK